jgi:hypothetical protein
MLMKAPACRWWRTGTAGWVAAGALIIAWDLAAPEGETLSERFRAGVRRHPGGAAAITAGWTVVTLHLYDVLPKKADPLHAIRVVRDRRRVRPTLAA